MIRFAIVGTNWITQRFVEAAHETGTLRLAAVYSRTPEKAHVFAEEYKVEHTFSSIEEMAASDLLDAVYIASPNALHCEQILCFLKNKKHVICEKPLASNLNEVEQVLACARKNQVILLEGFKTAYLPNFAVLKRSLPLIGRLRKAVIAYCQYSSRYQSYAMGENPNAFNPRFSSGSIMDIGYYCVAMSISLFGEPLEIQAQATLLESGVDAHGTVVMKYDDFDVTLLHSKVSNSYIPSEIQGEEGSFLIEKMSECQRVVLAPRAGGAHDLSETQHANTMRYEAEYFASLIKNGTVEHPGLTLSRQIAFWLTEIRRQTNIIFPADKKAE